jgi:hypothetical protein
MFSEWVSRLFPRTEANMLDVCLDAVLNEGQTLEEALGRFPEHAERLRPILEAELEALLWLRQGSSALDPHPGFVRASQGRLLGELGAAGRVPWSRASAWMSGRNAGFSLKLTRAQLAGRVVLALLLLASLWISLDRSLQASHTSLPGDPLYPVKLAAENVRLWAAPGASGKARLHTEFAQLRLLELQSLVIEGQYEQVAATVERYEIHVRGAVLAIMRVADRDMEEAHALALTLRGALAPHTDLVLLISGGAPQQTRPQFERLRLASQYSASELEKHLTPGSGELENLSGIEALICYTPRQGRLTDSLGCV